MVENLLVDALVALISEAVEEYRMPVKNGDPRAPKVVNGFLPPKRSLPEDDFPFVVVRAEAGTSDVQETITNVAISIGCYTEEYDGHKYCLNVLARIKSALSMLENGILDKKYVLQYPMTWQMVENQPYPEWQLDMVTKWAYNTPQAEFSTDFNEGDYYFQKGGYD